MYRLVSLGSVDLLGPNGRRVNSVVQQPKRFLILAYLALASRRAPVRRTALLPLFWPEFDDARAKQALNQAIYFLRRSLKSVAAVVEGHDELQIAHEGLSCDAHQMEDAVAAGDYHMALELYRGDLLPGMFVEGAEYLESWLEEQRSKYRTLAIKAARGLARRELGRDDFASSAHWAWRLAELAGTNDAVVLEAMGLLVDGGHGPSAAEMYSGFERRLNALDIELSPETKSQAQRVLAGSERPASADRRKMHAGPSLIESPGIRWLPGDANGQPVANPNFDGVVQAPAAEVGGKRALFPALHNLRFLLVLAACVTLVFVTWNSYGRRVAAESSEIASLATIRVSDFHPANGEQPAAGVAHSLSLVTRRELARMREPIVLASAASQHVPAGPTAVSQPESSGSNSFDLTGVVRVGESEIAVDGMLTQAETGILVHGFTLAHPAADFETAAESLGRRIASAVRREIGRVQQASRSGAISSSPDALEAVQLAEELIRDARDLVYRGSAEAAAAGLLRADSLLAAAERLSPSSNGPAASRAKIAAERAWLALVSQSADDARAKFEEGMTHASRAVSLGDGDPNAHEIRGTIAYWMWETLDFDHAKLHDLLELAEVDLKRAIGLDPTRARAWSMLGNLAHRRGDFAGAFWATKQAYNRDVYHDLTRELLVRLFVSSYEIGDDVGAAHWCTELSLHSPKAPTAVYCSIAAKAWRQRHDPSLVDAAWKRIGEMSEAGPSGAIVPRLEMMVASVLAGAGLPDSAESTIRRARDRGGDDPELLHLEAHARMILGHVDSAAALLDRYVSADPGRRSHVTRTRRFGALNGRVVAGILIDFRPKSSASR